MCGIALIVSGVRIDLSFLLPNFKVPVSEIQQVVFSVDDIKRALRRRGPDGLGSKNVFLQSKTLSSIEGQANLSSVEDEEAIQRGYKCCYRVPDDVLSTNGEAFKLANDFGACFFGEMQFVGATLQLRGLNPIVQPFVDASGNILVYNGEIFGGIHVSSDSNDGEILMQSLGSCCLSCSLEKETACCSCRKGQNTVPELLSKIKGPWALIYWQDSSKTLWFGRDAFGRRSLLVHWPTLEDSQLLLSSVSPLSSSSHENADFGDEGGKDGLNFWEELPCGVYSIPMGASTIDGRLVGEVRKHEWTDPLLKELIIWERSSVKPEPKELLIPSKDVPTVRQDNHLNHTDTFEIRSGPIHDAILKPAQAVLIALRESVMQRTASSTIYQVEIESVLQRQYHNFIKVKL